ncbi:hypothetical protein [Nocardia brasiliensis]|uniref:hypothetical protein n=1 Tax=Nocardia brasiliensis TaxID=37326 RepID=UPI003D934C3D
MLHQPLGEGGGDHLGECSGDRGHHPLRDHSDGEPGGDDRPGFHGRSGGRKQPRRSDFQREQAQRRGHHPFGVLDFVADLVTGCSDAVEEFRHLFQILVFLLFRRAGAVEQFLEYAADFVTGDAVRVRGQGSALRGQDIGFDTPDTLGGIAPIIGQATHAGLGTVRPIATGDPSEYIDYAAPKIAHTWSPPDYQPESVTPGFFGMTCSTVSTLSNVMP